MHSYLLNRRGNYHFRIRVPADLSCVIPSAELVKSLKTRDRKQARIHARSYLQSITKTFSLFRSGFLSEDQVRDSIDSALRRSRHASTISDSVVSPPELSITPAYRLSSIMTQFVSDRRQGWSVKTKMENEASFRLILDIVGDVTIVTVDRDTARRLRDTLRFFLPISTSCFLTRP